MSGLPTTRLVGLPWEDDSESPAVGGPGPARSGARTAPRLRVSIVTCAYNEAQNLPCFLPAVLGSRGGSFEIEELVAVASGCRDRTVAILREWAHRDPRVRVIVQEEKRGKAAAAAAGLAAARGEIVAFVNADTLPRRDALEALIAPFRDPTVQLVTSHPVPIIGQESLTARVGRVMWEVHDQFSSVSPKVGEAYAVRRGPIPISPEMEDDDLFFGAYAEAKGWGTYYARDAVVYNRVPASPSELLRQRYRINRQVLGFYRRTGFSSGTWSPGAMARAVADFARAHPRKLPYIVLLLGLELTARALAVAATMGSHRPLRSWSPIESTKLAIEPDTG